MIMFVALLVILIASVNVNHITEAAPLDPLFNGEEDAFEGDIIFPPGSSVRTYASSPIDDGFLVNGVETDHNLWDHGIIPYETSENMNGAERNLIAKAIKNFARNTCIKWVPRTDEEDYVMIKKAEQSSRCNSNVGKIGGINTIHLGARCFKKGTIIHEMMHTVGFFHEQSRIDRDNYITINYDNVIREEYEENFQKYSLEKLDKLGTEYDCGSILHYPSDAFAIPGKKTIIPKSSQCKNMGQRLKMSPMDINDINLLYKCGDAYKPKILQPKLRCHPKWKKIGDLCYIVINDDIERTFSESQDLCTGLDKRATLPWFMNTKEYKQFLQKPLPRKILWLGLKANSHAEFKVRDSDGNQCTPPWNDIRIDTNEDMNNKCADFYRSFKGQNNGWGYGDCDSKALTICQIRLKPYKCH